MNKTEWSKRSGALRSLLGELRPRNTGISSVHVKHSFGAAHHEEGDLWYIYGLFTNNCIATVKFILGRAPRPGRLPPIEQVVVRYRRNSWYAGIIQAFKYGTVPTLHVPSDNLSRHSRWLIRTLQERVRRNMNRAERDRLAEEQMRAMVRRDARTLSQSVNTVRSVRIPQRPRYRGRFITRQHWLRLFHEGRVQEEPMTTREQVETVARRQLVRRRGLTFAELTARSQENIYFGSPDSIPEFNVQPGQVINIPSIQALRNTGGSDGAEPGA